MKRQGQGSGLAVVYLVLQKYQCADVPLQNLQCAMALPFYMTRTQILAGCGCARKETQWPLLSKGHCFHGCAHALGVYLKRKSCNYSCSWSPIQASHQLTIMLCELALFYSLNAFACLVAAFDNSTDLHSAAAVPATRSCQPCSSQGLASAPNP